MNEKVAGILKDTIEIIIHYIPFGILEVILVLSVYGTRISFFKTLLFLVVPLSYYAIRNRIKKPFGFLLAHLAVLGVVFLIPGKNAEHIFYAILAVIYLFGSISLYMKPDDFVQKKTVYDIPVVALIGMVAVEYFFADYMRYTELLPVMAMAAVFIVLLYYTVCYTDHYLKFFRANRAAARNMPRGKMLKEGGMMTMAFTITSTLILYFSAQASFVDDLFYKILRTIRSVISYLSSLLPEHEAVEETVEELPQADPEMFMSGLQPGGEPGILGELLDQFTKFAAIAMIVCIVMGFIISIVAAYLKAFKREDTVDEIREEIGKEEVEKIKEQKKEERKGLFDFLSAGERIRHIFAKVIQKRIGEDKELEINYPVNAMTARELSQLFGEEKKEPYFALVTLYEKARYSPKECSGQDVSKAKKLAKALV